MSNIHEGQNSVQTEFQRAASAVREAEQLVTQAKRPVAGDGWLAVFVDAALVGPWLVMAGGRILRGRLVLAVLLAGLFTALFWLFDRQSSGNFYGPAIVLAFGSVYFGLPSRTVTAGVRSSNIEALASTLGQGVIDSDDLERLKTGVGIIRAQTFERLARFNVIAGISWAALFWFISSHVLALGVPPAMVGASAGASLISVTAFLIVMGTAASYATAVRVVYQTLDFAILEISAKLSRQTHIP
jgi:hypothetical protein